MPMHVHTDSLFLGTLDLFLQVDRLQRSRSNTPILCRLGIFLAFVCLLAVLWLYRTSMENEISGQFN